MSQLTQQPDMPAETPFDGASRSAVPSPHVEEQDDLRQLGLRNVCIEFSSLNISQQYLVEYSVCVVQHTKYVGKTLTTNIMS